MHGAKNKILSVLFSSSVVQQNHRRTDYCHSFVWTGIQDREGNSSGNRGEEFAKRSSALQFQRVDIQINKLVT
jgi:hypothetical protein